jgi:hypothetical protein
MREGRLAERLAASLRAFALGKVTAGGIPAMKGEGLHADD